MAESQVITLGLSVIKVGTASAEGTMPTDMSKIGKTYKDSCQIAQDAADITEHFEEGKSAPEVRKKTKKMPKVTFSLMDCDCQALADYIGGAVSENKWGYDGSGVVANKAIRIETEQGLIFDIPNGDIEAVINGQLNASGIFLVDFTVTPMAVTGANKAIQAYPKTVA